MKPTAHPPQTLLSSALAVRENAYAPYSGYRVGAAIIDENGDVYAGCNVENAAYPEGQCAEAGAISAMVSNGGRRIAEIVVVGGKSTSPTTCSPCGGCRQKIREFAGETTTVWYLDDTLGWRQLTIEQLLPGGFVL